VTDPTQVNIRPLGSVVLVLPKPSEPDRVGSVQLADVKHEPETSGLVIAIGSSFRCEVCRSERDPDVVVGDWVLFARSAGGAVTLGGTDYVVLMESELLAVLAEEPAVCEVV
jgi:chaperonin GroES